MKLSLLWIVSSFDNEVDDIDLYIANNDDVSCISSLLKNDDNNDN